MPPTPAPPAAVLAGGGACHRPRRPHQTDQLLPCAYGVGRGDSTSSGSVTVKEVPSPTVECTTMVPPWAVTIWCAMNRPRPRPRAFRRRLFDVGPLRVNRVA